MRATPGVHVSCDCLVSASSFWINCNCCQHFQSSSQYRQLINCFYSICFALLAKILIARFLVAHQVNQTAAKDEHEEFWRK